MSAAGCWASAQVTGRREAGGGAPSLDALDAYLAALALLHGAVSASPHGRVSPRVTVVADDAPKAVELAMAAEEAAAQAAGIGGVVTALVVADAATRDGESTWIRAAVELDGDR